MTVWVPSEKVFDADACQVLPPSKLYSLTPLWESSALTVTVGWVIYQSFSPLGAGTVTLML